MCVYIYIFIYIYIYHTYVCTGWLESFFTCYSVACGVCLMCVCVINIYDVINIYVCV